MTTQTAEVAHSLGRAEAVARIKAYTGWVRGHSDLKGSWQENVFTFSVSLQGFGLRGTIRVEEDRLRLEAEMPAHAPAFNGWLPQLARTALLPLSVSLAGAAARPPARVAEPDASPTVLFLHIPKAGGQTLSDYFTSQCSAGEDHAGGGMFIGGVLSLNYGFFRDRDLDVPAHVRPFLRRPDLRAVMGHFTFGLHEHVARPWRYATVLRDPVERVVSLYYYVKLQERMSLEEFVASPPFREIDNDQTRRIAGVHPDLGAVTRSTLERARDNLRRHFAVMGVMERYEETLVLLHRRLGWTREVAFEARNVNPERMPLAALAPSTVEAIRGWNELDCELHRFVGEWMDEAIAQEGPAFHAALERRRALVPPPRA